MPRELERCGQRKQLSSRSRLADDFSVEGSYVAKAAKFSLDSVKVAVAVAAVNRDLRRVAVQIFATYPGNSESDLGSRSRLLAPLAIAPVEARVDYNARRDRRSRVG